MCKHPFFATVSNFLSLLYLSNLQNKNLFDKVSKCNFNLVLYLFLRKKGDDKTKLYSYLLLHSKQYMKTLVSQKIPIHRAEVFFFKWNLKQNQTFYHLPATILHCSLIHFLWSWTIWFTLFLPSPNFSFFSELSKEKTDFSTSTQFICAVCIRLQIQGTSSLESVQYLDLSSGIQVCQKSEIWNEFVVSFIFQTQINK